MSEKGQQDRAYPRAEHKAVGAWFLPSAGQCASGKGGGAFFVYVGTEMAIIEYKVPKFDVYNRKLILKNPDFDVYADGGDDPASGDPANRLPAARQDWWLGFGVDTLMTGAEVVAQDILITEAAPMEIELDAEDLPQPTDAGWDNKIYIYLYWGDANFVKSTRSSIDLDVIKHDYDIKI